MDLIAEYKKKLVSADEAVGIVKSGDWIDYGSFCGTVDSLDKALARRRDELKDVKIWSTVSPRIPAVMAADPTGEVFTWNSWHMSGIDRRLADKGTPGLLYSDPV